MLESDGCLLGQAFAMIPLATKALSFLAIMLILNRSHFEIRRFSRERILVFVLPFYIVRFCHFDVGIQRICRDDRKSLLCSNLEATQKLEVHNRSLAMHLVPARLFTLPPGISLTLVLYSVWILMYHIFVGCSLRL